MNITFFFEDADGTLLLMLPQQAIIPAGKETTHVEEAVFFCGYIRAPHITLTMGGGRFIEKLRQCLDKVCDCDKTTGWWGYLKYSSIIRARKRA